MPAASASSGVAVGEIAFDEEAAARARHAAGAAVLLLRFTGLPAAVVSVLYICTAMPCAATTAMQSEMYHCDNSLASRGVALSTAFSILTLPLMLLLA
mgnify:CR=1 FL=1